MSEFLPLGSYLCDTNAPDYVCIRDGKPVPRKTFLDDVTTLVSALKPTCHQNRHLVFCESSYLFAVTLFAVWQTESVCVLPPNNSVDTIEGFRDYADTFITDKPFDSLSLKTIHPQQHHQCCDTTLFNIPDNRTVLELFTSGTTGDRKQIAKTLANINSELAVLQSTFSPLLDGCLVFSTVTHQHIYGLLHKVLSPLSARQLFVDETYFYPERLFEDMSKETKTALISTPAYLNRLPDLIDLEGTDRFCNAIFSSGSLLDKNSSLRLSQCSGVTPTEILGSTETGGVAWRRQNKEADSEFWTTLESVEVSTSPEKFLQVRSPFVFLENEGQQFFTMGDMAVIEDHNRFKLLGRGDRIVKIGEKRVSLQEIEKNLQRVATVEACAVFPITNQRDTVKRTVLACVVEPSHYSDDIDKTAIIRDYKKHLSKSFSQTVLPRYWRFVENMPIDQQGKTSLDALKKLFREESENV